MSKIAKSKSYTFSLQMLNTPSQLISSPDPLDPSEMSSGDLASHSGYIARIHKLGLPTSNGKHISKKPMDQDIDPEDIW